MALESLQAAPPGQTAAPRVKYRFRLRFRKAGDLRLVSHIDLMHVFERMMRRAIIPFASTQGFHPKPVLVFASALALGVAGLNEVVELELAENIPPADVLARLNQHAPPGLVFLEINPLDHNRSGQVRRAFYRLALSAPDPELPTRCLALMQRQGIVVERAKPRLRRVDIRPYLVDLQVTHSALEMTLWVTPYGAARPEEVVKALGLGACLDEGAVLERTHLEIIDELPEDERWLPDIPRLADAGPNEEVLVRATATEPLAPVGEPLLPNPLSFET